MVAIRTIHIPPKVIRGSYVGNLVSLYFDRILIIKTIIPKFIKLGSATPEVWSAPTGNTLYRLYTDLQDFVYFIVINREHDPNELICDDQVN